MPNKYQKLIAEAEAELAEKARAADEQKSKAAAHRAAFDKAKYTARAAIEGAGINLADVIAGITNVPANYAAGNFENPARLFKEGRRDFIGEQKAFKEEHPALNTAGEIIGSLLGFGKFAKAGKGVFETVKNPITRNMFKSAAAGGLYGFNRGLTEDESPSIFKAFADGGAGVLGGAVFSAIPSADRIQHRLRLNMARKQGKKYFNELREGGDLIREGQPNARVTSKGWDKIRHNPNPDAYQHLPRIREIYSTGEYAGPMSNYKPRTDDIKQWFFFGKPIETKKGIQNMGVQIGEDRNGRLLYNFLENTTGNKSTLTAGLPYSLNNIIQPTLPKVNGIIERLLNPYGTGAAGSSLINALLNYKPSKEEKK
jgi:hypothetical protein